MSWCKFSLSSFSVPQLIRLCYSATAADLDSPLWQSIPELAQTDADLTLIFLAPNAIKYSYPNNDPFFGANYYVEGGSYAGVNLSYFSADEYVNVMACQDQYQYCNGDEEDKCTPLTGYQQAYAAINSTNVGLNMVQESIATRIILNSRTLSTYHSIGGRGAQALRVSETIQERNQMAPIPDNQWQVEVASWFAVSMARLQRSAVEFAAPSLSKTAYPAGSYLQEPEGISRAMCYSQKVGLVSDTISFSVLGLVIIFAVGLAAILLYLILEPLVAWFQRKTNSGGGGGYRRVRWVLDDKMQVQRMMFEEAGMGGVWTNLDGAIPVTESKDVFADLHHVDPRHPRLGRQWTGKDDGAFIITPQGDPVVSTAADTVAATAAAVAAVSPDEEHYVSPIGEYNPVLGIATAVPMPTPYPYPYPSPSEKTNGQHQPQKHQPQQQQQQQQYQVYQKQVYRALTPQRGYSPEGSLDNGRLPNAY